MPPPVERLVVSLFDLHLWTKPLVDLQLLNPMVAFLADPAEYNNLRGATRKIELANLCLFPLNIELSYNKFWERYALAAGLHANAGAGSSTADVSPWLLPLRGRPKLLDLSFQSSKPKLTAKAYATIWLWPFGWSSQIEFGIRAPLTFNEISAISAGLRGKRPAPFVLGGKPKDLSEIFKTLAQMVVGDIGKPGKVLADSLILPKHLVLTLVPPKEIPPRRYGNSPSDLAPWSDADRARLHGALLGRQVTLPELIGWEKNSVFMLTKFDAGNFALTHFDNGSLLMLGEGKHKWRESRRCFARNVSCVCVTALALLRLIERRAQLANGGPVIGNLAKASSKALDSLVETYRNSFCRNLLDNYGPIKRAREIWRA